MSIAQRVYGAACREADGVGTNCGQGSDPFQACAYGPCGAKSEWLMQTEPVALGSGLCEPGHDCPIHIFEPDRSRCGFQAEDIMDCISDDHPRCGDVTPPDVFWYPEPYVDHPLSGTIVGTCPFNECKVGGTPF